MKYFRTPATLTLCAAVLLAGGCKKTDNTNAHFAAAIDTYYNTRPACLWSDEIKFPVQADTSDESKTQGFDALVDRGLLLRTTAEKKVFILGSKQVTNYDLSADGHTVWTADPQQPGYGNFCYGHRTVATIDNATPSSAQPGATTVVAYHYTLGNVPVWANAPETQNAFPQVRADLSGSKADTATLTNTTEGWVVSEAPRPAGNSSRRSPATPADATIVP